MKKIFIYTLVILLPFTLSFVSCSDDDDDNGGSTGETVASVVKSMTYSDADWSETHTYSYLDNGRVSKIVNSYEGGSEDIVFDWSAPGKLSIKKGSSTMKFDVNEDGFITKEYSSSDKEYYTNEYDSEGFLIKRTEFWDGGSEVKYDVEVTSNNVIKHKRIRSGKDYEKIFQYYTGQNVCHIQQTNPIDSYWKIQSGAFGKASNRYVENFSYGYVGEAQTTSVLSYTFDDKRRPETITKNSSGWEEHLTFTYYE